MKTTEPSRKLYVTVPTSGTDKMERDRKALTTAITKLIQRFGFEDILQCMSSNSHLALEGPNGKASKRKPTKKAPSKKLGLEAGESYKDTPSAASHEEEKAVTVRIEGGGRRATWLVDLSKPAGKGLIEKAVAKAGWEIVEVLGSTIPTYKPTEVGLSRMLLVRKGKMFAMIHNRQHPASSSVSLSKAGRSWKMAPVKGGALRLRELLATYEILSEGTDHEAAKALFEKARSTYKLSSKNGQKAVPWRSGLGGRHMGSDRNYR